MTMIKQMVFIYLGSIAYTLRCPTKRRAAVPERPDVSESVDPTRARRRQNGFQHIGARGDGGARRESGRTRRHGRTRQGAAL
jgi:hypothetical protein